MEKKIHLQNYGMAQAIEAENLKIGSVLLWNGGTKSKLIDVMPRGKKQLILIEEYVSYDGKIATYSRVVSRTRLIAYSSINAA